MNKKIIISSVACGCLAIALLAGCGTQQQTATVTTETTTITETAIEGAETGGWEVNENTATNLATDEAVNALEKALENYTGASFEIIAQLGSQVVKGTNYSYLCKETLVTKDPITKLSFVEVYEDLDGNAEITNVKDFNIGDYWNVANDIGAGDLSGGWSSPDNFASATLPASLQSLYDTAMQDKGEFHPITELGSQLVAGNNYAILSYLTETSGTTYPCIIYIYEPLEGNAELTNIYYLNPGELFE